LESEITRGRFDNCEFIDRCDGVAARDPCDHIVGITVGQEQDDDVLSVGFVLVYDPFGEV